MLDILPDILLIKVNIIVVLFDPCFSSIVFLGILIFAFLGCLLEVCVHFGIFLRLFFHDVLGPQFSLLLSLFYMIQGHIREVEFLIDPI